MKTQTKLLASILAIGLSVAMVGGSTMAWFTDSKSVGASKFTAGTVTLNDIGDANITGLNKDNVNPGDPFQYGLNIVYTGSKPVYLRVKVPEVKWTPDLKTDNVLIGNEKISQFLNENHPGWTYKNGYFYYNDVILGTKADGNYKASGKSSTTIPISLSGVFDGETTTNAYQGAELDVSSYKVEVIQATNDAPTKDCAWISGNDVPSASSSVSSAAAH